MGGAEDNERVDVEMELAVGVVLDLMGGRISRRQAENRLVEDQAAHGQWHLTDTALIKGLQRRRYAELRATYKAEDEAHYPQNEKMASVRALEEKRRSLVRDRDHVRRDIRSRERGVTHVDNSHLEQQDHGNRTLNHYNIMALNHYNGMIEGVDTALAVVLNSGSVYSTVPFGATGSSRSVSPTEETTSNIPSPGGRSEQEAAGVGGVIPSARLHLRGGTTTERDPNEGHGPLGGLQGPGGGAATAQA